MTDPTVLTIVLNWRTAPMTLRAARAALAAMEGIPGALTVVDNDSGDGSFEMLSAALADAPRARVIRAPSNGGFGAGNNFGIRAGLPDGRAPDYVYILNSDAFPAPDAIRRLRDHLEAHPRTAFAGSYIHGPEGEPHTTLFRFPTIAGELEGAARFGPLSRLLRGAAVPLPIPDRSRPVDWVAGASLMMRRAALDRIGLFDEAFFLYYEETDLCLRARRAGWSVDYVRESEVMHIGSVSTGLKTARRMPAYWFDSRMRYFVKNHGRAYAAAATGARALGCAIRRARVAVQGADTGDPPHFLKDLLRHAAASVAGAAWPGRAPVRGAAAPGKG
ncbi:glycosyltransferase [Oceanicella actignis]|uniref:Glycosyltransferase 2-like domain-containing protein n=1 Tax=Oceanicella actignis TaxID=1189325 RepID=A0A1M7T4N8_9RHOB|nr:glycosyltransferase [Oceanicella actignis]TYO88770.1 hypothetical protein LY05_01923 [Oceanicella actignis]SET42118.1 hypothetical protein SAMN04488119_104152 [Oceanicella actignis]SHN65700.1 hypothetical protein SAMN05216200_104152 [Oceanicella actignis]